jgi:hypothetical protein
LVSDDGRQTTDEGRCVIRQPLAPQTQGGQVPGGDGGAGRPNKEDDPGNPAREDLTTILAKIAERAGNHDRQAARTVKARAR